MNILNKETQDDLNTLNKEEATIELFRRTIKSNVFVNTLTINKCFNALLFGNMDSKVVGATGIFELINMGIIVIDIDAAKSLLGNLIVENDDALSIIESDSPTTSFKFYINRYINNCQKFDTQVLETYTDSIKPDEFILERKKGSN